MFDRLTLAMMPLMKLAIFIAILCGLTLAGMGVASMMGKIDMGPEFSTIEPSWIIGGGIGIAVGAVMGYLKLKDRADAAQARLSKP